MMKCRTLPRYHLLRFLHPAVSELRWFRGSSAVAFQRRRLLGTVAAREMPSSGRSRRKVSKEERKAMIEAYVSDYRMMNGGKFPGTNDTMKQVGGGYYTVRSILQEIEYNYKLANTETTYENSVTSKINKVGVSPLSRKDVNGISEVGVVLDCEVLGNRTFSNQRGIAADDGSSSQGEVNNKSVQTMEDMPIGSKSKKSIEHDSSIVDHSAKRNEISQGREVLDTNLVLVASIASNNQRSSDDSSIRQGDLSNNSVERTVDMSAVPHDQEMYAEQENSTAGRTAEVNRILESRDVIDSEVLVGTTSVSYDYGISAANGSNSQWEGSDNSSQTAVDSSSLNCKHSAENVNSTLGQAAKDNEISEVGVPNCEIVSTATGSRDYEMPSDYGSKHAGEVSNHVDQTMVDTTITTTDNEISAKDEISTGQKAVVNEISEDDPQITSKADRSIEAPDAIRNSNIGTIEEAPSHTSLSDQSTREKPQNETQKTSLWGNFKSFASSIMSIWQK